MDCPRCHQENPPHAKFCLGCGARLTASCGRCGAELPESARFCPACGQAVAVVAPPETRPTRAGAQIPKHLAERILRSKAALEGERKQVTVLFADLKGSMELLADRDPEDARRLLDPVLERMMEAVHQYEGTVNQVMGDGVMALFGAPIAHEDHSVRACYAALRMQEEVGRYAEELRRAQGLDVQIRIGLNAGEVVVRSIGSDLQLDYTAVGQTTHLAARMEQLARPGSTLLTESVLRGAEGRIEVKALGLTPIKGLTDPVAIYEIVGAGAAHTRLQAAVARGLTRFVGRESEMERLRDALDQAAHGRGQVVAVVGEPGVGKSRLFHEFIHSHRTQGWLVLEASSVSYGKATAYMPLVALLKAYFKIAERDDTRAIRAKTTGNLLTLDEGLKDGIAAILRLLDALPDDHEFHRLDAAARRGATLEWLKRILLRESRNQPVLLVFEDLHWIDAETQALLDALVDSLPATPLLLAVNYRPEYRHAWGNKTYYQQLQIVAFPPETAAAMLRPLLGGDPALDAVRRMLIERTEGNPLFLEESVRSLVDTGVLVGERGAYRLGKDPVGIQVPSTVHAIIAARIDALQPDDKQLLQAASVIGKDVPQVLLAGIADCSDADLRSGLARLQTAEFIYELKLFPDLEYTFTHALTLEVAYNGLLQSRRRDLHARIIGVIERVHADRLPEHFNILMHHAFRGEVWPKALHYLNQTASSAARQSIDAHLGGPENPGNLWWRGLHERAVALTQRERVVLASFRNFAGTVTQNFRLGQACHSLGEYDRAAEALTRNIELLEGDLQRELFGLAGFPSVLSRVWLALCEIEQDRVEDAVRHAGDAVAIADGTDHSFSQIVALAGQGTVHLLADDIEASTRALERALVIERAAEVPLLFALVAPPLGLAYARAGRHDEGVKLIAAGIESAEAIEYAANHALRLVWLGEAHLLAGQADPAKRIALRALETARRYGERGHEVRALSLLGHTIAGGNPPDRAGAEEAYRDALAIAEPLGMRRLSAFLTGALRA